LRKRKFTPPEVEILCLSPPACPKSLKRAVGDSKESIIETSQAGSLHLRYYDHALWSTVCKKNFKSTDSKESNIEAFQARSPLFLLVLKTLSRAFLGRCFRKLVLSFALIHVLHRRHFRLHVLAATLSWWSPRATLPLACHFPHSDGWSPQEILSLACPCRCFVSWFASSVP